LEALLQWQRPSLLLLVCLAVELDWVNRFKHPSGLEEIEVTLVVIQFSNSPNHRIKWVTEGSCENHTGFSLSMSLLSAASRVSKE
jgi:hypothetical protein